MERVGWLNYGGATQYRGDNVRMQSITKWVIEFHCVSSWYSESKRRSRARMIERRREEGGKPLSDPLKYPGMPCLELIDWNLHAKLATSLHGVEPMPEKPRDKGGRRSLDTFQWCHFQALVTLPKIDSLAVWFNLLGLCIFTNPPPPSWQR